VVRRNMNRRHMTGDHHGRTAGRATLLARAMDERLDTHTASEMRKAVADGEDFHEVGDSVFAGGMHTGKIGLLAGSDHP
jgi:hypothetical protein